MARAEETLALGNSESDSELFTPPEPMGMKVLIRRLDTPEGRQRAIETLREMAQGTPEEAAEQERDWEVLKRLLEEDRLSSYRPLFPQE